MSHAADPVQLIFFSIEKGPEYKEILAFAAALFPSEAIYIYDRFETFAQALREPGFQQKIILILPGTRDNLFRILTFRDLLRDRPLILVLPDSDTDTMIMGATLYPRYIGNVQDHLTDVRSVLEKMYHNLQTRIDQGKNDRTVF